MHRSFYDSQHLFSQNPCFISELNPDGNWNIPRCIESNQNLIDWEDHYRGFGYPAVHVLWIFKSCVYLPTGGQTGKLGRNLSMQSVCCRRSNTSMFLLTCLHSFIIYLKYAALWLLTRDASAFQRIYPFLHLVSICPLSVVTVMLVCCFLVFWFCFFSSVLRLPGSKQTEQD